MVVVLLDTTRSPKPILRDLTRRIVTSVRMQPFVSYVSLIRLLETFNFWRRHAVPNRIEPTSSNVLLYYFDLSSKVLFCVECRFRSIEPNMLCGHVVHFWDFSKVLGADAVPRTRCFASFHLTLRCSRERGFVACVAGNIKVNLLA